ncbi:MAG: hypothetical protein GX102_14010 [Porphyromonadaceae bacterium]|jgi:hypothetical protein|nr:hypothetical protein [Porphyromonadaceae bacterium]
MKEIRKTYQRPEIEEIKLDKEISLQLQSPQSGTSPGDPFPAPGGPQQTTPYDVDESDGLYTW